MAKYFYLLIIALMLPLTAHAGEVEVIKAEVRAQGDHRYSFSVTLRHADSGWDHYADRWDVLSPDGNVIASRILAHPHVNEQPFTRSLGGVVIPTSLKTVIIRAHDLVHGDSVDTLTVTLP